MIIPSANRIPISSAGVVSEQTKTVLSPLSSAAKTESADKHKRPDAAPGLTGVPVATKDKFAAFETKSG